MTFTLCKLSTNQLLQIYYLISFYQHLSTYYSPSLTSIWLKNYQLLFLVMQNRHWSCSSIQLFMTHFIESNFMMKSYHLVYLYLLLKIQNYAFRVNYSCRRLICYCNNFACFYCFHILLLTLIIVSHNPTTHQLLRYLVLQILVLSWHCFDWMPLLTLRLTFEETLLLFCFRIQFCCFKSVSRIHETFKVFSFKFLLFIISQVALMVKDSFQQVNDLLIVIFQRFLLMNY